MLRLRHINYDFARWIVRHNLWLWAGFLCILCLYTILLVFFDLHSFMRLDILYCFIKWFGCHGSWLWACLLQLIRLYTQKKNFCSTTWKTPDTSHYFSASDFEQVIGCLKFLFLFAANLQVLLCCILWEASGENMLIMPLGWCGYSNYWFSS